MGRVDSVHLFKFLLFFLEFVHKFLIAANETDPFLEKCGFPVAGWLFGKCVLLVDIILDIVLISADFGLEVLEVHLYLLLQLDVAADCRLHLLSLRLQ